MNSQNLAYSVLFSPGWVGSMDLNNNPRTWAENRFKILEKRRRKVLIHKGGISLIFSGGSVSSAGINPKNKKAPGLIMEIDKEIRTLKKFLNSFPRP